MLIITTLHDCCQNQEMLPVSSVKAVKYLTRISAKSRLPKLNSSYPRGQIKD